MSEHAVQSPSTFKAREICPSYVPDQETTAAADRGSALHLILQHHGHKAIKAKEARGMVEADEVQLQMVCSYIEPYELKPKVKIIREHRFNLKGLKITDCDKGTADLLILDKPKKHIDLMDYKFGWIEVDDAEVNIQLGIYVLGAFLENPWAESVMAHILQPARDEVSTHLFHRMDVTTMTKLLLRAQTIAARSQTLNGVQFNPVPDNCLWCDRKADCLALHEMVLKASSQANLVVPDCLLVPEDFNDVENAGEVYDFAEIVIKWASAIKYKIISMVADEDQEVRGHELRETAGKRSIRDTPRAQEILTERFGVSQEEFLAKSTISITAAEALVAAATEFGEKGRKSKEMSSALMAEGVIATGNPSRFLVRVKTKADK